MSKETAIIVFRGWAFRYRRVLGHPITSPKFPATGVGGASSIAGDAIRRGFTTRSIVDRTISFLKNPTLGLRSMSRA